MKRAPACSILRGRHKTLQSQKTYFKQFENIISFEDKLHVNCLKKIKYLISKENYKVLKFQLPKTRKIK